MTNRITNRVLGWPYGTSAVHERGLRVYTTLNINMQRVANQALRDGLHSYERRHGWKGNLPNVLRDNLGKLDSYEDDDWRHAIEIGYRLPGIRFNSVASTIGPGVLAATINVLAGGIAVSIGRVAARRGAELPIAAGLSGSMLATPYLSVTDLAALLIAAWLILRLQPSRWLKALMMVGYLPFFFANEPHMHGPFLVLEGAWLIALLVFAVSLGVQRSTSPVMQVTMPPPTQIVPS